MGLTMASLGPYLERREGRKEGSSCARGMSCRRPDDPVDVVAVLICRRPVAGVKHARARRQERRPRRHGCSCTGGSEGVKARGEGPWRRQGQWWWVGVAAVGIAGRGSLSLDLDWIGIGSVGGIGRGGDRGSCAVGGRRGQGGGGGGDETRTREEE